MDLISRHDAIEAIKEDKIDLTNPNVVAVFKATGDFEKVETQVMTCDRHIEILKDLPSERKRGKWIYGEDEYGIDGYHCDKCGFFVPWDYAHKFINYIEDYKFCPGCGADMREVDDERPD